MCRIIEPAISTSIAVSAMLPARRRAGAGRLRRRARRSARSAASKSPTSSRSSIRPTSGVISSRHRSLVLLDPQQIEHQRRGRARAAARGRDRAEPGADALGRIVADALRPRSPWFARPTAPCRSASDTNGSSEYDVSSFSATLFQTASKPSVLPSGEAATSSCASASSALLFAPRRGPASGTPARADRSACRSRSRAARRSARSSRPVMRLTTACISCGAFVSAAAGPSGPAASPASSWPTAAAMFFSTGSSCSGSCFGDRVDDAAEHAHQRGGLDADAAAAPALLSSDAIRSASCSLSPAMPSSSRMPASSRSNELPCRQLAITRFHTDRIAAGALAQHLGVIDLAQLDVAAGHRRPHAGDAAVGCAPTPAIRPSSSRNVRQASTSPPDGS